MMIHPNDTVKNARETIAWISTDGPTVFKIGAYKSATLILIGWAIIVGEAAVKQRTWKCEYTILKLFALRTEYKIFSTTWSSPVIQRQTWKISRVRSFFHMTLIVDEVILRHKLPLLGSYQHVFTPCPIALLFVLLKSNKIKVNFMIECIIPTYLTDRSSRSTKFFPIAHTINYEYIVHFCSLLIHSVR